MLGEPFVNIIKRIPFYILNSVEAMYFLSDNLCIKYEAGAMNQFRLETRRKATLALDNIPKSPLGHLFVLYLQTRCDVSC